MNFLRTFFGIIFSTVFLLVLIAGVWLGAGYITDNYFPKQPQAFFVLLGGAYILLSAVGLALIANTKK